MWKGDLLEPENIRKELFLISENIKKKYEVWKDYSTIVAMTFQKAGKYKELTNSLILTSRPWFCYHTFDEIGRKCLEIKGFSFPG